jgi:membrane-associated HD superfamily phosphohydrolase
MSKPVVVSRILLASASILFACSISAVAQSSLSPPPSRQPTTADGQDSNDKEPITFGSLEDEMRAKRRIKLEEKQYQENLERAREADKLSIELRDSYEQKKSFTREDTKKLERLEKLTRRIRSEAGGSDEDTSMDNPPNELQLALSKLAQVTDSLRKVVEKTPRQVISATVIQQANVVLQLVKVARNLFH